MKQWTLQRKSFQRFPKGCAVVSFIFEHEGQIQREDRAAEQIKIPADLPAKTLGWWRWTAGEKPPTQKELNVRLEQLWMTLKDSTATHREALAWLVGLYLTRKKILRQEPGGFVHAKSGERTEVKADAIDATQMEAAMGELMAVIQ